MYASLYLLLFCTKLCCKSLVELWFSNGHRLNSINQTVFFYFEIFWKTFLLKKFFSRNWYVCVHIVVFEFQKYLAINFDFVNILKNFYVSYGCIAFLNFIRNWYGCIAFLNFKQSGCFLWKLFFLRDFFTWLFLNIKNI